MTSLNGRTPDIAEGNIEKLKALFPEAICEGKVAFDKLKQLLGDYVDDSKERYNFTWNGKAKALRLSQMPSMGTLRPRKEESKDWDTTQNLYLEGDNLEVLKLLQKSYHNKVKMIYIDPPYNTDGDFVYPDDYSDNLAHYLQTTGQVDDKGNKMGTNNESNGRYHTDWLNLMYPRLRLARNLLANDGVVLVNMDEHEIINLQKLMSEVFGEGNDLGTIVWDKRNPKGDAKGISYQHEYIVVYAKNIDSFLSANKVVRPKKNAGKIIKKASQLFAKISPTYTMEDSNKEFSQWVNAQSDFSGGEKAYNKIDENGKVYQSVSMGWPNKKRAPDDYFKPLVHPVTKKECPVPERGWRNPPGTMDELLSKNLILFGADESTQPRRKYLLEENMSENIPSLLYYGGSDDAMLSAMNIPFDTPKAVDVCFEHIQSFAGKDAIVMDFFSGSATVAHAVMAVNAYDNGKRRFIMVQLPEIIDEKHEAFKAGYKNICEIGKERIRRAGEKILQQVASGAGFSDGTGYGMGTEEGRKHFDVGFKVFALDSSNLKKWQPDYDDLELSLQDSIENYVAGRTELDVVYEIILKMGLDLTCSIEETVIGGKRVYSVGFGALQMCLDDAITPDVARGMVELHKAERPVTWKVVFKDNGFASDSAKTNVKEIFKCAGLEEDAFTTV